MKKTTTKKATPGVDPAPVRTADDLFALPGYDPVPVPLPGTGRVAFVRVISGAERDEVESFYMDANGGDDGKKNTRGLRAKLVLYAACDDTGARLFSDDDFDRVAGLPSPVLNDLFEAASKLNLMDDDAIEDAEGN